MNSSCFILLFDLLGKSLSYRIGNYGSLIYIQLFFMLFFFLIILLFVSWKNIFNWLLKKVVKEFFCILEACLIWSKLAKPGSGTTNSKITLILFTLKILRMTELQLNDRSRLSVIVFPFISRWLKDFKAKLTAVETANGCFLDCLNEITSSFQNQFV